MQDPTLAGKTLDRYFHICAFFNSRDEEYGTLGQFYKEGLDWGEKALHIVNPALMDDHRTRLATAGIDVPHCEHEGQLQVLSWEDANLTSGAFDQDVMLRTVEDVLAMALEQGFTRSRIMGNMAWAFEGRPGSDQLIEYEVRVNEVLTRTRQPAICVYDTAKLTGTMMMDLLRAHQLTLVNGVLQENPFFTPPDQMLQQMRARRSAPAMASA